MTHNPVTKTSSPQKEPARFVRRHRISTRLWHWGNVAVIIIMLMSGLMIFNAHPHLYWGEYGANHDPSWLEIGNMGQEGYLRVGPILVKTTGVLGVWSDASGVHYRAFPSWATIPSRYNLALARNWHLTFAWLFTAGIVVYLLWSLANRHISRDLLPKRGELTPRHFWTEIKNHVLLRFHTGDAARRYNALQKLTYLFILIIVLPALVLSGLAMSPAINAAWPWLQELFFGRQSARSIHFICASLVVLFVIVHLVMVLLAGPVNEIRSMITGNFRLPKEKKE